MNSSNVANDLRLPAILSANFRDDFVDLALSDGRQLSVPLAWYPKLASASLKVLRHFEISPGGYGIHWPDLDEDLSVQGFLFPKVA